MNKEWFGQVRWCEDDLITALEEMGYPATEENISRLYSMCDKHWFTDCMVEAGWEYIENCIDEANGFEK